jgi:hypothetical protein
MKQLFFRTADQGGGTTISEITTVRRRFPRTMAAPSYFRDRTQTSAERLTRPPAAFDILTLLAATVAFEMSGIAQ